MANFISPNILGIECLIVASAGFTQSKNPFGTQKELQNRKVVGIQTYSNQDIVNSPISTTAKIVPANVFNGCFLTLYRSLTPMLNNQGQIVNQAEGLWYDLIPLCNLRNTNNNSTTPLSTTSGNNTFFAMQPAEISWTKSYITIAPAIPVTENYAVFMNVHYILENQNWRTYSNVVAPK
jgi:hypothetical protein